MRKFTSAADVIDHLGGTGKFAAWWGCADQRVSDWRKRGFPSNLYLVMSERLRKENGIFVSPLAWGIADPATQKRARRAPSQQAAE